MSDQFRFFRNLCIRILLLGILFVVSLIIFSRRINEVTPNTATSMSDASFPLVCMQKNGVDFNCLHGYAEEMDVTTFRDSITPLSSDRGITIKVMSFGAPIRSISYEIVTIDGTKSLENTKVIKLNKVDEDTVTSDLTLMEGMLMGREYVMKIQVSTGGRNIYYYTHVLLMDGLHTNEYLNFAAGFWEKCIHKSELDTIAAAVEPDETTDVENTLSYMDIHDSVSQLTWGALNPQTAYKPTPRLTEINENTATMTMDYRISTLNMTGSEGNGREEKAIMEVYNVHEYYRLRFTDSRVFLLNFERTCGQVFDPKSMNVLSPEGIVLGITDKNIEYKADEKNRVIAFVQEDVLWTYQTQSGTFTRVFGFPQAEQMDVRDFYKENTIRILRVSTEGNVIFAVGGYMNRGSHEGGSGIAVYSYDAKSTMVSELAYLSSRENTERIRLDMEDCLYLTTDGSMVYLFLDGILYRVSLAGKEVSTIVSGIRCACHGRSSSGRYFSYLKEGEIYGSKTVVEIDFETGVMAETLCSEDEYVRILTYMKEDLVLGVAKKADVTGNGGNTVFPMYQLLILNGDGKVIKTYEPEGYYVTSISQSDNLLNLTRVKRGEIRDTGVVGFISASPDQIMSSDTTGDVAVGIATRTDPIKQTEVILRVGSQISFEYSKFIQAKMRLGAGYQAEIPLNGNSQDLYYVYASGGLTEMCTYCNEAISRADAVFGVVLDQRQNYVWVRGDKETTAKIDVKKIPEVMKNGTTEMQGIQAGVEGTVVDLTGCTLDQVLYFVSHGRPVLVETSEGIRTIVGYDEFNTHLLKPGEEDWYYYGIQDSTALFAESGNHFVSVIGH